MSMTREHIERWREWIAEHPQQPPGATVLCDLALRGLDQQCSEGMVMVPSNPTHPMLDAARKVTDYAVSNIMLDLAYRHMLSAAQKERP